VQRKADTPTMGGIMIVLAIFISTVLWAKIIENFYVKMGLFVMIWLAVLGGIDDWLKLTRRTQEPPRPARLGEAGLPDRPGRHHRRVRLCPRQGHPGVAPDINAVRKGTVRLDPLVYAIVTVIVLTGTSNAVNLTDGMDGLSAGCMTTVAFAFMILG